MDIIQLYSLNHVVSDLIDILHCDSKIDINYHSKTIDYIYDCTYKTIYQYVTLFLDIKEKNFIIEKFFVKTEAIENSKYLSLDQLCAYTISQFIYFDIYLIIKSNNYNAISLSF
jgi:hypothetical protein